MGTLNTLSTAYSAFRENSVTAKTAAILMFLLGMAACGERRPPQTAPPETPQLWCWLHTQLSSESAFASVVEKIDQAHAAGYTGIAFWDVSFVYLSSPDWPDPSGRYLRQAMDYAASRGMKTLAQGPPFGYSNDLLHFNPNWAEALRIQGTRFIVDSSGRQLVLRGEFTGLKNGGFEDGRSDWFQTGDNGIDIDPAVSHSGLVSGSVSNAAGKARFSQQFKLLPWRQYHVRLFVRTQNYVGPPLTLEAFDTGNQKVVRLYKQVKVSGTQAWTQIDAAFNSQSSTNLSLYFGVWGGHQGTLWLDDVNLEETALVFLIRRAGAPVRVYDPATGKAFNEGSDFDQVQDARLTSDPQSDWHQPPRITLPAGSTLRPGQTVAVDFYAAQPVDSQRLGVCLTDPAVTTWLDANARKILDVIRPDTGIFLQYDEMRQVNSCKSCRDLHKTAGQLLAWHAGQAIRRYRSLRPDAAFWVWSDMFDPYANAHSNYYLVEGDLAGSWEGLPSEVTIMNWNMAHLRDSLRWFAGESRRQPTPHRQIIAGYYDTRNGAAAAVEELRTARGIPGIDGLMYTTWEDDYSQMQSFATAARKNWQAYRDSVLR